MSSKLVALLFLVLLVTTACDGGPGPAENPASPSVSGAVTGTVIDNNSAIDSACKLRVAWDPYEPYSYSTGTGLPLGYDIEVVTKVAELIDCSLSFSEMAWSDILVALRQGSTDLTVGTGYKPDRAEWSWYSESYRNEVIGLMVRVGTLERFPGENLDELFQQGLVFGKTTDDTYDQETEAVFTRYAGQVRQRVSEAENLQRLLNNSIDGFLVEVNVGSALARRQEVASQVIFHPLAFEAGAYRLQMSKKTITAARVAQINAAIQQLAASGWLSTTIDAYGIQENGGEQQ